MTSLDFFFDYRSPYAYLAHTQLSALGASVTYAPFDIADLMKRVENVPTSVLCKPKNRYVQLDLQRWAATYRVPLVRHPDAARIDARRLLRATLAAGQHGVMAEATSAIYRARWCEPLPLATSAQIADVLEHAGLAASLIEPLIDDPALDEALDRATSHAEQRGVFGAPTIFVDGDMYFGNDRMPFVRAKLGSGQ